MFVEDTPTQLTSIVDSFLALSQHLLCKIKPITILMYKRKKKEALKGNTAFLNAFLGQCPLNR